MKAMALVFILFFTLSTSAFAFVDRCCGQQMSHQSVENPHDSHTDKSSLAQLEAVNFEFAKIVEGKQGAESDANHRHCKVNCSHTTLSTNSNQLNVVPFEFVLKYQSYNFTFSQIDLEGPFRPPLV